MGVTWFLGFGVPYSVVMEYLFIIVNSLQGEHLSIWAFWNYSLIIGVHDHDLKMYELLKV